MIRYCDTIIAPTLFPGGSCFMKTPINAQTLRQHLTYNWWKYALVIILSALAVNLYYTTSAYRPPEEKKVDFYIYGLADETALRQYMADIYASEMPDMEEMGVNVMMADDSYGSMVLSTYVAAGEGDVYILPRDNFVSLASSGAFLPLEGDEELMAFFTSREISLQSGWRRESDSGENHLFGIPVSKLPGLERYCHVEGGYVCILVSNRNDVNSLKFLRLLCRDMIDPPAAQ